MSNGRTLTGLDSVIRIETGTDETLLVPIPLLFFQQESAIPSGYASEHESIAFFLAGKLSDDPERELRREMVGVAVASRGIIWHGPAQPVLHAPV